VGYLCSSRSGKHSDVYYIPVTKQGNRIDQKIKEIVSEAQLILTDLTKSGNSVDGVVTKSIPLFYLNRSLDLGQPSSEELTKTIEEMRKLRIKEVRLLAFSNEFDSEALNNSISEKRMKKLLETLKSALGAGVKVISEISKKPTMASKKSAVEISYEIR